MSLSSFGGQPPRRPRAPAFWNYGSRPREARWPKLVPGELVLGLLLGAWVRHGLEMLVCLCHPPLGDEQGLAERRDTASYQVQRGRT